MSFFWNRQRLGLNTRSLSGRPARRNRQQALARMAQIEALEGRALLTVATISTVAGNGTLGFSGNDGPATSAAINQPTGVVTDGAGNIFFSDSSNYQIREIVKASGKIIAVAGNGTSGTSGDGGAATAAQISTVNGLAIDGNGNLFLADSAAHVVRKVNLSSGVITLVAGTGVDGNTGNGGAATAAQLSSPAALALDTLGNLYIGDDSSNVVRKVDKSTGVITTVLGTGVGGISADGTLATAAQITSPDGLALDSAGNLYFSDPYSNVVREVVKASGKVITVAGDANFPLGFSGDGGSALKAQLYAPYGLAFDAADNLYIADLGNNRVREVLKGTGVITTVAGNGTGGYAGDSGPAALAQLNSPWGVAVDSSGNLVIGDNQNNRIRQVTFSAALATSTSLVGSNSSAVYGQAITYTATVSPSLASSLTPGGAVQFVVDGVNYGVPVALSQGRASLAVSGLGAGVHAVGARYTGDSTFGTSAATNLSQTLSKAVLVVRANAVSGRAGDPLPALTTSYSGFVNGDTASVLTLEPTVSTTATQVSLAGSYPISVTGGSAENYTISTQGSTLVLTAPIKPVSVKGIMAGSKLTGVTIVFNGPMSAYSVQSLASYMSMAPGKDKKYGTKDDVQVALKSATYNASTFTLTLKFKSGVASTPGLRLTGTGLADVLGGLIDGARTGKPGSNLVATFTGKTVKF